MYLFSSVLLLRANALCGRGYILAGATLQGFMLFKIGITCRRSIWEAVCGFPSRLLPFASVSMSSRSWAGMRWCCSFLLLFPSRHLDPAMSESLTSALPSAYHPFLDAAAPSLT